MIEALKSDEIAKNMGGRFKLCVLIQRRLVQLMDGARPMIEREGRSDLELAIEEIVQGKIAFRFDPQVEVDTSNVIAPEFLEHLDDQQKSLAAADIATT